jgi:hypothetical protein
MRIILRNPLASGGGELTQISSADRPVTEYIEAPGIPYSEAAPSLKARATELSSNWGSADTVSGNIAGSSPTASAGATE